MEHESDSEAKDEHIKKLESLKQRLFAADKKLSTEIMNIKGTSRILQKFSEYNFDETMSISSLKYVRRHFGGFDFNCKSFFFCRKMTADMENSNKLTEIQMHALKQDLEVYLAQLSDLEIENVLHDNNKLKLARAK